MIKLGNSKKCSVCKSNPCVCTSNHESEDLIQNYPMKTHNPMYYPVNIPNESSYSPKHPKPKKILIECGRSVEVANFDLTATEIQTFKLE